MCVCVCVTVSNRVPHALYFHTVFESKVNVEPCHVETVKCVWNTVWKESVCGTLFETVKCVWNTLMLKWLSVCVCVELCLKPSMKGKCMWNTVWNGKVYLEHCMEEKCMWNPVWNFTVSNRVPQALYFHTVFESKVNVEPCHVETVKCVWNTVWKESVCGTLFETVKCVWNTLMLKWSSVCVCV